PAGAMRTAPGNATAADAKTNAAAKANADKAKMFKESQKQDEAGAKAAKALADKELAEELRTERLTGRTYRPFKCQICQDDNAEAGVILSNCNHKLCVDCFRNFCANLAKNDVDPKC